MGGQALLAGLKEGKRVDGLLTDLVPSRGLRIVGGLADTPASMAKAVDLINRGEVRLYVLAGESFSLNDLDAALALLDCQATGRDAWCGSASCTKREGTTNYANLLSLGLYRHDGSLKLHRSLSPMGDDPCNRPRCTVSDTEVAYAQARAKGGVALVMLGSVVVA